MLLMRVKIILLIAFYCFFLLLLFSETFISDFQEVRRSVFVDTNKTETLRISKTTWDSFSDKDEFKYNGDYYDVKSVVCENEIIKVKAIKDSFEIILKTISKTSNSKSKKNESLKNKKTIDFYYSKIPIINLFSNNTIVNSNYYYTLHLVNDYLFFLFRPPLFY